MTRHHLLRLLLAFVGLGHFLLAAQNGQSDYVFSNPVFQNYTMKQGLASNYCYDVMQDKRGFVWLATLNGLSQFNGTYWTNFQQQQHQKKQQLPSNWVIDLSTDADGNIWINTDRGFCKYNLLRDSVEQYNNPVVGWGKVCWSNSNQVFISAWNGVDAYSCAGAKPNFINHFEETKNNSITQLFQDAEGLIWICPEDHPSLYCIQPRDLSKVTHVDLYFENRLVEVKAVSDYTTTQLLLLTKSQGALIYDKKNKSVKRLDLKQYNNATILCAARYTLGSEQFFLFGTEKNGLLILNTATGHVYACGNDANLPNTILSDQVNAIAVDNNQGIWLATSKGVSFFHPSQQQNKAFFFSTLPGFPVHGLINAIGGLSADSLLIGTENNGLFLYNQLTKKVAPVPIGNNDSMGIRAILNWKANTWFIATSHGLFVYDQRTSQVKPSLLLNQNEAVSILQIRKLNETWLGICTTSGLVVVDVERQQLVFDETPSDSKPITKDVALVGQRLWILRYFDGCEVYDLSTKNYCTATPKTLQGAPINYPKILQIGSSIFIATSFGLIHYPESNCNQSRMYTIADGLEGNVIENICPAATPNTLYYTTPVGVFSYNWESRTSKAVTTYENYPQKWYNQFDLFRDSTIVCSVSDYILILNPRLRFHNTYSLQPIVTSLVVNERPTAATTQLSLRHFQNNLSFQFVLPIYPEAEKNLFYYQLSPGDTTWRSCSDGKIRLFNLASNTYTLKICSSNNAGLRSNPLIYTITIDAPFYKTIWFYTLLLLASIAIVLAIVNYRKKQALKITQIRNQISRDLHDELGAHVSSIHIMARMLAQKTEVDDTRKSMLDKISTYSIQISDTINDIIWNINPRFDSLDALVTRMIRYASETLDAAEINYSIVNEGTLVNTPIDSATKYSVYLIFKEAVNNAAKYSKAKLITITFDHASAKFGFRLVDDGLGFDLAHTEQGNGIVNMEARAKELDGHFHLNTAPGKGTEIHFWIKR